MNEQTKSEYRKLAKHFYKKNGIDTPTAKKVSDALKECAQNYRPDYWRRLRSALVLAAMDAGAYKAADTIRATKNPVTSHPSNRDQIKPKQHRQKAINLTDETLLMDYLFKNEEATVFAAITLISHLGCRPAELIDLVFLNGHSIMIPSAKQTSDGKRGLDRIIEIEDTALFNGLIMSHEMLVSAPYTNPIRYVQRRLDVLTQRLWPKRKTRPSLYTWRHQLGSDLKASNIDPNAIAVIMGHQSTESVKIYGNARSYRSSRDYLKPSQDFVNDVKRKNTHRLSEKKPKETFTFNGLSQQIQQHYSGRQAKSKR
ncbi:site-specific integrase [Amphritea atlantica]|uniref:Site-specific integrase n=1 Tax=Amphritea atlantica TaxID=355243 RepID=A0ABY5GT48_9GAMM|nr:site-specific integrase [Amphritea atlantica]